MRDSKPVQAPAVVVSVIIPVGIQEDFFFFILYGCACIFTLSMCKCPLEGTAGQVLSAEDHL